MAIKLEDYEKYLEGIAPEIRDVLEGTFTEASHVMSPTGMETYLEGAKALANLGRGKDLVISYLQQMPLVAKECGEDIITDCLSAAMCAAVARYNSSPVISPMASTASGMCTMFLSI